MDALPASDTIPAGEVNPILSRLLPGAEQICTDRHWAVLLPDGVVIGVFAEQPDTVRLLDDETHHFTESEARAWLEARRDAWVQVLGAPTPR